MTGKIIIDNVKYEFTEIDNKAAINHITILADFIEELIIPQEINGKKVVAISSDVFGNSLTENTEKFMPDKVLIGKMTIPAEIHLNESAFKRAPVDYIVIAKGVSEIPKHCFDACDAKKIVFDGPKDVRKIRPFAFYNCYNLTQFIWPKGCSHIPKSCFGFCGMTSIEGIEDVISVGENAFEYSHVRKIRWPKRCSVIPANCFDGSALEEITFEDESALESIEYGAFSACKSLIDFTWPSGCKTIPSCCFIGSGLTRITGTDNVENVMEQAFRHSELKYFEWPSKCRIIPSYCFMQTKLSEISRIESVKQIGCSAFEKTAELTKFSWPAACDKIPEGCFKNSGIVHISGIENVKKIESFAFSGAKIEEIDWPKKCEAIPHGCFEQSALKSLRDIDAVTYIGARAFKQTHLEEFVWPSNCSFMFSGTFLNSSLKKLTIQSEKIEIEGPVDFPRTLSTIDLSVCSSVKLGVIGNLQGELPNPLEDIENVIVSFDAEIILDESNYIPF